MSDFYFTYTPDFNNFKVRTGDAPTRVHSEYLIEAYKDGLIAVGEKIIGYFDPEGSDAHPYEGGWSDIGTITQLELVEMDDERDILKIWATFDSEA